MFSLSLVLSVLACGDAPSGAVPEEAPPTPVVEVDEMEKMAENVAIVPSPVETQAALRAAGIDTDLGSLIPERTYDHQAADADRLAVRTGVVLADLLLTVETADKATLLERLGIIQRSLARLEAGPGFDATLSELRAQIESEAMTRDELLQTFEELSGAVIPELELRDREEIVPLIQAGSWLEGAHLVSRALQQAEDRSAGEKLLRVPRVVNYFIAYVATEGEEKASRRMRRRVIEVLTALKAITEKPGPLTDEDLAEVEKLTGSVLALL